MTEFLSASVKFYRHRDSCEGPEVGLTSLWEMRLVPSFLGPSPPPAFQPTPHTGAHCLDRNCHWALSFLERNDPTPQWGVLIHASRVVSQVMLIQRGSHMSWFCDSVAASLCKARSAHSDIGEWVMRSKHNYVGKLGTMFPWRHWRCKCK